MTDDEARAELDFAFAFSGIAPNSPLADFIAAGYALGASMAARQ